jgi:hypothetical protein
MREYGIVTPQFWIGNTGKALRGNLEAQVVALYLMTSPHANMIGVYYCPLDYIAKETGLPIEGASKALASLIEGEFCGVDGVTEEVFVVRMAAYQIGEQLSPKDKRCIGIARELEKVSSAELQQRFRAIYSVAYHLPKVAGKLSPSKAPSKPEAGSEAGTGPTLLPGFARFWDAWPKSERKDARGKCHDVWVKAKAEPHADRIVAHVERLKVSRNWTKDGGEFIPAPLTYLNQRKWEGADEATTVDKAPEWCRTAGFVNVHEAGNAGCYEHTADQFRDGKRLEAA